MFVIAYWVNSEAVLFVVSFMFPLLLAFQTLLKPTTGNYSVPTGKPSTTDPLTGVPTRCVAMDGLANFLRSERGSGREAAVLHINIDKFRQVNDRFGLEAGDSVLAEISNRIGECIRDRDILARIDGDVFAVVLSPIRKADVATALAVADRIKQEVARPFSVDQVTCHLTCSIGICLSSRAPSHDVASVFASAETALLLARKEGPNATRSFSPKMRREAQKLKNLSVELDEALENGRIRPYFQPQICADSGELAGFEALARWEHPENGVILPGLFLNAIESGGKSERLGEVILYHSLTAIKAWDNAGLRVPSVGVNFSSSELRNPKLVEKIKWEVDRFDIAPHRLTIEILEDVVSDHDDDVVTRNIRALAAQGFGIDLDDFGTGHAAIANIRRFAVNRIKIDRSFIMGIDGDEEQKTLTSAIIRMAESLGLETLAEGVETIPEHAVLAGLGCRYLQGFGIGRPIPFDQTFEWMKSHQAKINKGNGPIKRAG